MVSAAPSLVKSERVMKDVSLSIAKGEMDGAL